jgi:hypothetical protein
MTGTTGYGTCATCAGAGRCYCGASWWARAGFKAGYIAGRIVLGALAAIRAITTTSRSPWSGIPGS